jgi:hypothetical protein
MSTRREFLAGLAAGPLLAPNAASAADPPDSILSKPRLGAEFFLNNSETRDSVAPRGPAGGRVDRGARAGSLARSARPADGRPGLASFRAMQGQRPVGGGIEQLGRGWPGNRTVSGIDAIGGGHRLGYPYSPAARVPNRQRAPWAV